MFQDPDHLRTVSLKLSEVLNDVGVNKKMVMKRRRMALLAENLLTTENQLTNRILTVYNFGSQSEGSTTLGLNSDLDILYCNNIFNVIQDWEEWQPGMINLLTIQNETVSPGYCLLQLLYNDVPLPVPAHILDDHSSQIYLVSGETVLTKNSFLNQLLLPGHVINGPAATRSGRPGIQDSDVVLAFPCKTWHKKALLVRQSLGGWPTEEMKKHCMSKGFFVVPVSSKSCQDQETEWRISTSVAERCLMFSLNMTQLRCYILMKMIVKTFINPRCNNVVSSFMCKTVLFYCISGTRRDNWRESNLLACLICCITLLQKCVRENNCPHFIIPENNLLVGRMSPRNRIEILEILEYIVQSEGHRLFEILFDDLGTRLHAKMNMMNETLQFYESPATIKVRISAILVYNLARTVRGCLRWILAHVLNSDNEEVQAKLSYLIFLITNTYTNIASNDLDKSSAKLLIPLFSPSLASVKASLEIQETRTITSESFLLFSDGLNSDVASGRLKLASALYCVGDLERAEFTLRHTEDIYDLDTVVPVCACYDFIRKENLKEEFVNKCINGNEELIQDITAFCVSFMRCEIHCVPKELQYEMFRSTQEDMQDRDVATYLWMNMASVDSLPFLYFLQYKTYGDLQRVAEKEHALFKLTRTIETVPGLGHRETALNLLGQCMEQENRHNDALHCYMISLTIRGRNNAANFHICRLINSLINT